MRLRFCDEFVVYEVDLFDLGRAVAALSSPAVDVTQHFDRVQPGGTGTFAIRAQRTILAMFEAGAVPYTDEHFLADSDEHLARAGIRFRRRQHGLKLTST